MRAGVGSPGREAEVDAVDDVAPVGRQRHSVALFEGLGTGLRELPGETAYLDHRAPGPEGEHHRHLQQHPEGVANGVGVELGEALGAISALEQKRLPPAYPGELRLEKPRASPANTSGG